MKKLLSLLCAAALLCCTAVPAAPAEELPGKIRAAKKTTATPQPAKKKTPKPTAAPAPAITVSMEDVVQLGTAYCRVRREGKIETLPTVSLIFAQNVPEDHKLAIVNAPRLGRATMREGPSVKTAMFYTCYAGVIAVVLKVGKSYTRINYQGVEGYVKTSSLLFYGGENVKKTAPGVLSYNGKTTGRTTINLRNQPDRKSIVVASWPTGTEVTILNHKNGWYEVEARGIRGYVMEEYVTKQASK
ncbi:MAG: SH3 domain-containing protein [Clostridia bacterium]|nr:SH3 domain-containing protein [Clostridia bacterium]